MRAVLYARVSSKPQASSHRYSLPSQLSECRAHAVREGWTIVGEFLDVTSASNLDRPGFAALLQVLENPGAEIVCCHSLDRLARDPLTIYLLRADVENRGAVLHFALGASGQSDEALLQQDLSAAFARYENLRRVERSRRGKVAASKAGLWVGGLPPFGYRRGADKRLEAVDSQAVVIRRVFTLYTEDGLSIREIVRQLGIARSSVARILATDYSGRVFYNQRRRLSRTKTIFRPPEEHIHIGAPPIIGRDTFQRAQERLAFNRRSVRGRTPREYPLSGLLACGKCGARFVGQFHGPRPDSQHRTGRRTYRHRRSDKCPGRELAADRLEAYVWKTVTDLVLNPRILRTTYEAEVAASRQKPNPEDRRALQKSAEQLRRKLSRLDDLWLDAAVGLDKPTYISRRKTFGSELAIIEARMQAAAGKPELPDWDAWQNAAQAIRDDALAMRARLRRLRCRVTVLGDRTEVEILGVIITPLPPENP